MLHVRTQKLSGSGAVFGTLIIIYIYIYFFTIAPCFEEHMSLVWLITAQNRPAGVRVCFWSRRTQRRALDFYSFLWVENSSWLGEGKKIKSECSEGPAGLVNLTNKVSRQVPIQVMKSVMREIELCLWHFRHCGPAMAHSAYGFVGNLHTKKRLNCDKLLIVTFLIAVAKTQKKTTEMC